jgi:hypothetical protein
MTDTSNLKRAESILKEAKVHELISKDISELEDSQKIKLANKLVENARKQSAAGRKGEAVMSILFAADVDVGVSPKDIDKDEERYQATISDHLESGLPIPPEIEGTPPKLPLDLTELSDKQVRWLHGAFNACSARVGWLYAIEEGGENAAKQIADDHEESYVVSADRKDIGGKPKSMALLKAEAKENVPDIAKWRKREKTHSIASSRYKRLFEIYNSNCERLSREWSMRVQERESS